MIEGRTDRIKERLFLAIILILALMLMLANLGNRYLWQDEAENALVSKTILTHGVPHGRDEMNSFSQAGELVFGNNNIHAVDPWVPYYLTAASFKVFGVSTFVARLPYALFGIATIMLTYFFAKSITRDTKTASVATVLLLLSVPFLLLSRQCRYYSLVAFLSLLVLHSYLLMLEKNKAGSIIFVISNILIFHCNHLFCAALLMTVFTHALLCHRQRLVKVFVLCIIVSLVTVPWIIWVSGMRYTELFGYRLFNRDFLRYLIWFLLDIHTYVFPFYLLLIPLGRYLLSSQRKSIKTSISENIVLWKRLLLLFLFIMFTVIGLSIGSPGVYFRYITQLIPAFCIITAIIIMSVIKPHFKKAIVIIAIFFTAVFFMDYRYGKTAFGSDMQYLNFFDYIEEITHDYDGPIEGIVKYLKENADDDDTVAITYGDLPLKFYTNMRVLGGLTDEDPTLAKQADWVIIRQYSVGPNDYYMKQYLEKNLPFDKYEKITIDYPDIGWSNRPSPYYHKFRTVKDEDKIVIYRRQN